MAQKMTEIYEKFTNGDPITNDELYFGLVFFRDLESQLRKAGPVFLLAANEAGRVYNNFDSFRRARNEK